MTDNKKPTAEQLVRIGEKILQDFKRQISVKFNSASQAETQPLLDKIRSIEGVEIAGYNSIIVSTDDPRKDNPESKPIGSNDVFVPAAFDRITLRVDKAENVENVLKQI